MQSRRASLHSNVHSDGERAQSRSQRNARGFDGTGVCLRLAGEQEAAYTTLLLARWRTEAAEARVDAQLGNNRACTSRGRVCSTAHVHPLHTHAVRREVLWHHACASAEGPRTTSGAVHANRTNGASATPLGPVWVYARYPTTMHMSSVDAACVCKCGGPTHDERRRAIESHKWRLSDAARACVGVRTLPAEPAYVICRCSMRVQVRGAHARRTAPCNQIARMAPQRRRWGLCGCT
jgi:hypothetical protein